MDRAEVVYPFIHEPISSVMKRKMKAVPNAMEVPRFSPQFGAALEIVGYGASITAATFAVLMRWLSCEQAAVLTLAWLVSLVVLAWRRFDGGRHPCFFFLCVLTLFQAGRMAAYCAGGATDIFQVSLMTSQPFSVSPEVEARVLAAVALSALCIYAPCRWRYRFFAQPANGSCERFRAYLYFLFWSSVPVQLYKNFCYYQYAREHGGYLVFFLDHGGLAASIPLAVRAISLVSLPALVGIFILERRKKLLRGVTAVYFLATAPVLLTGSRGAVFSLILALGYVAQIKSPKRMRLPALGVLAVALVAVAALVGWLREEEGSRVLAGPTEFLASQGASLDVTTIAIAYRADFSSHLGSYLASELQAAFVAGDQANYVAGRRFSDDVAMFLNPAAYRLGFGSGSSYVAEAYVAGGLTGVVIISLVLGTLLQDMHAHSRHPFGLFLVALILPDVLWMSRGGLLDWVSAALRVGLSLVLLLAGWWLYQALAHFIGLLGRDGYARADAKFKTVQLSGLSSAGKA